MKQEILSQLRQSLWDNVNSQLLAQIHRDNFLKLIDEADEATSAAALPLIRATTHDTLKTSDVLPLLHLALHDNARGHRLDQHHRDALHLLVDAAEAKEIARIAAAVVAASEEVREVNTSK